MKQHEITAPIPLLDDAGNLTQPGWARKLYPIYDRSKVKGGPLRLKEWDYYLVTNGKFALALTIADNSYMGLDSISLLDFETDWQVTKSPMKVMTLGKTGLPSTSASGVTSTAGKGYSIMFINHGDKRTLIAHMDNFHDGQALDARVDLTDEPEDSIVICTPFEKAGHFYYNQKINCLRASGTVTLGEKTYTFSPDDSFAVLDWGRGVWTYHNTWYWGSASGLVDGVPFGFNLGYGFGDTRAATENMLFYNGRGHKLGHVIFKIPLKKGKADFLSPWRIESDDGRLILTFEPVMDRASCTDVKLIKSDQHQIFGRFSGKAVLDAGTEIELKDFFGFAEKVENKW